MTKILSFIVISFLLFSCNELSDKEMEIRLAELELIKLANEHLEEDIDVSLMGIHGEMALPQNKKYIKPIASKVFHIQHLVDTSFYKIESKKIDSILYLSKSFYKSVINTIGSDSSNVIHFEGETYKNVPLEYSYSIFKIEIDSLYRNQISFLNSLNNPSDFEWLEIQELSKSYIFLVQKISTKYLTQLFIKTEYKLSRQHNILINTSKTQLIPNEKLTFTVNSTVPYYTNFSIQNYYYDNSLIYNSYSFNNSIIDSILIPTKALGKHQINGTKYFGKISYKTDSLFNYTFDYEVIEN